MEKRIVLFVLILFPSIYAICQDKDENFKKTTFQFGGYLKADFLNSWYHQGRVSNNALLNDFHVPSQIPVGIPDNNFDMHFHVKESRFNFDITSEVFKKQIRGFIELDFLLSNQGNERVSNSFSPRLRHFYLEWDNLLIGQTWTSFMIVTLPADLDFNGAMDGTVLIRQPMIKFMTKKWWFSIENPTSTYTGVNDSVIHISSNNISPDFVVRRNFKGSWGYWSVSGLYRSHAVYNRSSKEQFYTPGYGLSAGGKYFIGKKGDDIRSVVMIGKGLGRYAAINFLPGSIYNSDSTSIVGLNSINGYLAYNHYWNKKLSSSFNAAFFQSLNKNPNMGHKMNWSSYSVSGNLKFNPVNELLFGVELMYGYREIINGNSGAFTRLQFSAKYSFGYTNKSAVEK